jgi:GT2 family glycosyltransferase
MNGNCVLVPREISLEVGNLDHRFVHAMGDIDYGLRAQAIGYSVWVIPGYAGTCLNDNVGLENSFSDPALPLCVRMRRILSPKALPPRAWFVLTRRHAGWLWPLQWAWPYLKVMGTAIAHSVLHPIASRGKQK